MSELGLYDLVEQQCNAPHIRDLLREYKQLSDVTKQDIRVGGSKSDAIKNLRQSVSRGHVPRDRVIDLLRECEENGQQHIFYMKPRTRESRRRARDFDTILEQLFGLDWDPDQFPVFEYVPDTYQWTDYRKGLPGKPNDWILKAYGQEKYFHREKVESPSPTSRVEYYTAETLRCVCTVRWNDPDILEIRVDSQRLESIKVKKERLRRMWELLSPAISRADFVQWELGSARRFVAANRSGHADFAVGDLRFIDEEGGTALFKPPTDEESIDDLPMRSAAVDVYCKKTDCSLERILWKIPSEVSGDKPLTLSTLCGGRNTNELAISARTSSRIVDHVTNKLREFDATTT